MVDTFFVFDAFGVAVVSGPATAGEDCVGLLARDSDDDERGGLRRWIAAEPFGVGGANRLGESVGATEDVNGAVLAVVAGGDAEVRLLIWLKRIANLSDGADEIVPADFFAQVVAVTEHVLLERAPCSQRKKQRANKA